MGRKHRASLSAERRVILVFVLSALASIVLVGGALWFFLQRAAMAQSRTYLEARANILAQVCEDEIAVARQDLEFLAQRPGFQQLPCVDKIDLAINGVPENVDVENRQRLTQTMEKAERFSAIFVLLPNGDMYLEQPFQKQLALKKYNMGDRPYFQEAARTRETAISDGFLGAGGSPTVVILVPIPSESGEVTGYIGGAIYLTKLSRLVSKESIKPFDAGFIVDRKGILIAHTDAAMLKEGVREHFIEHHSFAAEFIASGESMPGSKHEEVFFGECGESEGEKRHLTALVRLKSGWGLGLMRDRDSVIAEVRPMVLGITALVALLLAVISGLAVIIAQRIGQRWHGAERELRETNEYLSNLIDYSSAPIIVWNPQLRITRFNHAFELLSGRMADSVLGKSLEILFPPDSAESSMELIRETLKGERWDAVEIGILHLDGSVRTVLWNSANVLSADEKTPVATIAQGQDITERKQAEERLKAALLDLERSNKELEQFAYVASHDLQEPLRMVSSYTQLLAERYEDQLDEKAKKYIDYAVDGAIRMQRLINDLLAYSRVGSRGQPLVLVDSHSVLGEAIRNLATAIEENKAIITNDDLPVVRVDPAQMAQVFQNLLSNAIKFRGEDLPRVHVSARDNGGEWVFSVQDHGIGIEPQHADRVFVIFQRLHTRQEYAGTGIGLAVCKRIVDRHGGRIWYESEPGKGTTFFFTVPK